MSDFPPVRASTADPLIDWDVAFRTAVFVDGVEQKEVTDYDCEAGTVTRYLRNDAGHFYVLPGTNEAATETLTGVVTVRWRDVAP